MLWRVCCDYHAIYFPNKLVKVLDLGHIFLKRAPRIDINDTSARFWIENNSELAVQFLHVAVERLKSTLQSFRQTSMRFLQIQFRQCNFNVLLLNLHADPKVERW